MGLRIVALLAATIGIHQRTQHDAQRRQARRQAQAAARRLMATLPIPHHHTDWLACLRAAIHQVDDDDARTLERFIERYGHRSIAKRATNLARRECRSFPSRDAQRDAEFALRAFITLR